FHCIVPQRRAYQQLPVGASRAFIPQLDYPCASARFSRQERTVALAIFDLDNTLLGTDSDNAWGEFAVARGIVDAETYGTLNTRFFNDYLDGKLDVNAYLEFCLEPLSRYSREELERWHALFREENVEPSSPPRSLRRVRRAGPPRGCGAMNRPATPP